MNNKVKNYYIYLHYFKILDLIINNLEIGILIIFNI